MKKKINIIGGGIAGCYIALTLSQQYQVSLYEATDKLMNGNPYCHLHYGLLYPEISIEDCLVLASHAEQFKARSSDAIQDKKTLIMNHESFESNLVEKAMILNKYYELAWIVDGKHVLANEHQIIQEKVREQLLNELRQTNVSIYLNQKIDMDSLSRDCIWIDCTNRSKSMEQKTVFYFTKPDTLINEIAVLHERGKYGMTQITPLGDIIAIHVMNHQGTLASKITPTVINYVKSRLTCLSKDFESSVYINHSTHLQQLNQNVSNRMSRIDVNGNVIKVCLMKAISVISIADQVKQYLDNITKLATNITC